MCLYVEAEGWPRVSPSIAVHLIYQGSVSHLDPELMDLPGVAAWLARGNQSLASVF